LVLRLNLLSFSTQLEPVRLPAEPEPLRLLAARVKFASLQIGTFESETAKKKLNT